MNRLRLSPAGLLLAVTAVVLAACGSSAPGSQASPPAFPTGNITVFAAASLKESFTAIGTAFQAAHPGTGVRFDFGASSALAQQIVQGAPADVFASASGTNMKQVVDGKAASGSTAFARNVLEIAVPPNNPAKVTALGDLGNAKVKVVLCQPQVPCGALARSVLGRAKLTVEPVSLEADVKSALAKVQLGEADAALVYVTDVNAAGGTVQGIPIPSDVDDSTTYPIASLTASKNAGLAKAFVAYVLSPAGQEELAKLGFRSP